MATFVEIFRQLAHRLYDAEQDVVTGVSTGGSTTTIVDALALKYTDVDLNAYDRRYVYNEASGETGKVDEDGYAATGTLTVSPAGSTFVTDSGTDNAGVTTTATTLTDSREAWTVDEWIGYNVTCEAQSLLITSNTATVLTGTGWSGDGTPTTNKAWEISPRYIITGDRPQVLKNAINDAFASMYEPCFFPLSIHICASDENDMETAPATTFDANKKDATLANESTIVKNGGQSLKLTADDVEGHVHFGDIGANEGESLYAGIDCYVTSGDSSNFSVYDLTTPGTIKSATTDEPKWMELVFPFTVPSGCEQIRTIALNDANTDISYWDDYHIWRGGSGIYPCPSWLTKRSQVIDVRAFPHGAGGPASDDDYRVNERASVALNWNAEREDLRGNNPLHLWVQSTGGARPYIYALRPLPALSSDSDTTNADKDVVVSRAEKLIREPEKASEYLGMWRAAALVRPVATPPIGRWGVRIP